MAGRTRQILFALLALLLAPTLAYSYESRLSFAPDPKAGQLAARYARDMVQFAQVELGLNLDWSDQSVAAIEDVAAALHADIRRERGAMRDVLALVNMLGGYVGEVYRRNHGGEWGYVSTGGKRLMAVRGADGDPVLWPIERVKQRIRGNGNNVWAYYQSRVSLANTP